MFGHIGLRDVIGNRGLRDRTDPICGNPNGFRIWIVIVESYIANH